MLFRIIVTALGILLLYLLLPVLSTAFLVISVAIVFAILLVLSVLSIVEKIRDS